MSKKKFREKDHHPDATLWRLFLDYLYKKFDNNKELAYDPEKKIIKPNPPHTEVNYLAVVLDGQVQEVMRADNTLAALLLSSPDFIEFDPRRDHVHIGVKYENNKFISDSGHHENH